MPSKPLKAIKPMFSSPSCWKIVRGDKVQVMAGKDKGMTGEVLKVIRDQRFPRVFVSGVNMVTRHIRKVTQPDGNVVSGFTVRMEAPIHYSNVMLLDPENNKPVRAYFAYEDQPPYRRVRRTRGQHASNCVVPWPKAWVRDPAPDPNVGDKDTRPEDADEVTYNPQVDFTLRVPSAHKRLRELRELREAAAAAAEASKQQHTQRHSIGSRLSSSRGYHTVGDHAAYGVQQLQEQLSRCSVAGVSSSSSVTLQQRTRFCSSSGSSISSISQMFRCRGISSHVHGLDWCGVAAAPLLL